MLKSSVLLVPLLIWAMASCPFASTFNRTCAVSKDLGCQLNLASTVHLLCKDDICRCEPPLVTEGIRHWGLEWDTTEKECKIALRGPCGVDNDGLNMSCQAGLECKDGRCRDSSKLGTTPAGGICGDTMDCQSGLICGFNPYDGRRGKNLSEAEPSCIKPSSSIAARNQFLSYATKAFALISALIILNS